MNKKIKSQKFIISLTRSLQKSGKKIVTYNGSFDILHIGHIKGLQEAKKQGDVLIILLNSDYSINSYKGKSHPINSFKNRAELISALECVDYVVLFNEINPIKILEKIRPHIHCSGGDWGRDCIERRIVEQYGGKIHVLRWQRGFSTSGLIKKITDIYSKPGNKAIFLYKDIFIDNDFLFLKKFLKTEYKIIVIGNVLDVAIREKIEKSSVKVDAIYLNASEIGAFSQAVNSSNINLSKSWLLGYSPENVIAGRSANLKVIKVGDHMPLHMKLEPHFYAKDMAEAVDIIIKNIP